MRSLDDYKRHIKEVIEKQGLDKGIEEVAEMLIRKDTQYRSEKNAYVLSQDIINLLEARYKKLKEKV